MELCNANTNEEPIKNGHCSPVGTGAARAGRALSSTGVLLAFCTQESEATRRVMRGRRTLTRRYFTGLAIPGWLLAVLIGIGELILGGALYLVMNRLILAKSTQETNTYTPAKQQEV